MAAAAVDDLKKVMLYGQCLKIVRQFNPLIPHGCFDQGRLRFFQLLIRFIILGCSVTWMEKISSCFDTLLNFLNVHDVFSSLCTISSVMRIDTVLEKGKEKHTGEK